MSDETEEMDEEEELEVKEELELRDYDDEIDWMTYWTYRIATIICRRKHLQQTLILDPFSLDSHDNTISMPRNKDASICFIGETSIFLLYITIYKVIYMLYEKISYLLKEVQM